MWNPAKLTADALGATLAETYERSFGSRKPEYAALIENAARFVVERIANSDALYHNVEHTALVTLVGQDILMGRVITSLVTPEDWLHFLMALLAHDIGYVRGICRGDTASTCVIDANGGSVTIPRGASDAFLTPHHVERSKMFIRERAAQSPFLDADRLARAVELTRFPVPDKNDYQADDTEPALVRAADLIGQLADPFYMRKLNALYQEFVETGVAKRLGYESAADLADSYPQFFAQSVSPYIGRAVTYLNHTVEGKQWVAQLHSHVFSVEHRVQRLGAQA